MKRTKEEKGVFEEEKKGKKNSFFFFLGISRMNKPMKKKGVLYDGVARTVST